jgi:hypothetical protein
MKTTDILAMLDAFNRVYADSSLTTQEKVTIGNEVLIQLPNPKFVPYPAALAATERSIRDRIKQLEAPDAEKQHRTGPEEGPKEPSEPLRQAKSNPRGKGTASGVAK